MQAVSPHPSPHPCVWRQPRASTCPRHQLLGDQCQLRPAESSSCNICPITGVAKPLSRQHKKIFILSAGRLKGLGANQLTASQDRDSYGEYSGFGVVVVIKLIASTIYLTRKDEIGKWKNNYEGKIENIYKLQKRQNQHKDYLLLIWSFKQSLPSFTLRK